MMCPKCGGFVVAEQFLELHSPSMGWKCVNCGWLFQPTRHRSAPGGQGRRTSPRLPKG